MRRFGLAGAVALALLSCANSPVRDVITVDPSIRYQTMRGWEVNKGLSNPCNPDFAALRDGVWCSTDRREVELPPVSVPAGGALNAAIPAAGVITFWALPPGR